MKEEEKQLLITSLEQAHESAMNDFRVANKMSEAAHASTMQANHPTEMAPFLQALFKSNDAKHELAAKADRIGAALAYVQATPAEQLTFETATEKLGQQPADDGIANGRVWHDNMVATHGLDKMEQIWLQVSGDLLGADNEAFIEAMNRATLNVLGSPPDGKQGYIYFIE